MIQAMPNTPGSPRAVQPWSIVIFGFLALAISSSGRATLGLLMPVWTAEFGWTSSYISGVGATALIVMAGVAPFAGRLVDRMGPRFTLNLGLGLLGLGCGMVALMNGQVMFVIGYAGFCALGFGIVASHVVATAVTRSFSGNQGLAVGTATSGSTGGMFVIVPLIAALLAFASWRWCFGALSLGSLALIPCIRAMLARETTGESHGTARPHSSFAEDFAHILRRPAFHALFWSYLICGFTSAGAIETHLLPFAAFCGFPPLPSATAFGLLSLVNLFGMVGAGWLTDRVNRPLLLAAIYLLRGLTYIILANMPGTGIETLFAFAVLFGFVDYATVPVTASLAASHIGRSVMGQAMGMISAGHAIGAAAAAYFGGYVFDATGSYSLLWMAALWLLVGAGVMALLVQRMTPQAQPVPL
ncbi:MAG: MFS transporter [bacterium]